MDFRNLCQKLDVDTIRAKLPHLPALPALPQIKLSKAMPKLKSRKIFRSSREDVNQNSPQKQNHQQQQQAMSLQMQQRPPIPPAGFIKRTPTRISTISSLMHQDSGEESTYRSANSIDDDYPLPSYHGGCSSSDMRPIRSIRASTIGINEKISSSRGSNTQNRMTFTERLHRSYKDLSEFRLKNIFTKKTVVRKDNIHVQHYVTHYEDDLVREAREQERRDHAIAENYTFRFKVSQQNIDHSNSVTPDDSPRSEPIFSRSTERSVCTLSGDESGMETTPPQRKPGIAATRFAKVRSPPRRQSSSEQQSEREEENEMHPEPNASAVWAIQKQQQQHESKEIKFDETQKSATRSKFSYKERMRRLTSHMSTHEDSDVPEPRAEGNPGSTKMFSKLKGLGRRAEPTHNEAKRKAPTSPRSSDEEQAPTPSADSPTGKAINAIKHNFKRLQQSMKSRSQQTAQTDESGDENAAQKSTIASKTEKFKTRLRKFRSRDVSVEDLDADEEAATKHTTTATQSPIRQAITHKLESLKMSFKKRPNKADESHQSDDENSPEIKQKRSDTLIKKLKHISARKSIGAKDEPYANTDGEAADGESAKPKSRTTKFNEARQRTFKKVNEKMQHIKFFHKSEEQQEPNVPEQSKENKYHSEEEDWDESPQRVHHEQLVNLPPAITRRDFLPQQECNSPGEESLQRMAISGSTIDIPAARAAWTTKPILSQSTESDIDPSELPRVLIHQDNSDSFESTLIIAVTRPVICSSPIITEIKAEEELPQQRQEISKKSAQQDWVSNKKIIENFMEATPPRSNKKQSTESIPSLSGHKRKLSMDSSSNSDSDSWMPESRNSKCTSRRTSQTGLVSIEEKNEAWKVKTSSREDNQSLYKTKSIDIFEKSVLKGGVLTAFEDFDDELRNQPVLKIAANARNVDSCERESSEDTADDDNSSRITKISFNRNREIREDSVDSAIAPTSSKNIKEEVREKTLFQYGNSRESLIANFDENDEEQNEEDDENEDDYDDDADDDDRPPSEAPSPPPKMSPPPPPLPKRQPSIRMVKKLTGTPPPPLPKSKPPPLPPTVSKKQTVPPRIPERTASMARAPKPLVKTSSLRLVYSKQVKPADVGKVNKLISKFEPTEGKITQRPRVIPRRLQQDDSEDYSDEEEDYATMADKFKERYANIKIERDTTPTPTNTPKQRTPEAIALSRRVSNQDLQIRIKRELIVPMVVTTTDEDNNVKILSQPVEVKPAALPDLPLDTNFNNSRPNSEYGSPLEYPSSLRSSLETIPTLERRDANIGQRVRSVDRHFARNRRSMTRDDDNFYSFDSDEENSYYSISSTGSNRYIVEL